MKNGNKMNWMFKTGFILLMICIGLFFAAICVAYLVKNVELSVIFSGGGALLAFVGIILTMFSKPKKVKVKPAETETEIQDTDNAENQPVSDFT